MEQISIYGSESVESDKKFGDRQKFQSIQGHPSFCSPLKGATVAEWYSTVPKSKKSGVQIPVQGQLFLLSKFPKSDKKYGDRESADALL